MTHGSTTVTLITPRQERIEVIVPANPTVDQVLHALVEQHRYRRGVKLMGGQKILDGKRHVEEFPEGSLIVVGTQIEGAPSPTSSNRPRSPQASTMRSTHHHQSPTSKGTPTAAAGRTPTSEAPTTSPRSTTPQADQLVLHAVVPAMRKEIDIPLTGSATLADLVTAAISLDARLVGCKIAFRGKFQGPNDKSLHSCGIRDGDTVHIATEAYLDTNVLSLFRIEEDVSRVQQRLAAGGLTELERQGYYEELMRILFRTDDLQEVEGELRLRRKELVKVITAMQDTLKPATAA